MQKKLVFVFVCLAILFLSCGKKKEEMKQKEVIKIGVVLPLSGELANFGKTVLNGIILKVEQYNTSKPSTNVELKIEDSKGNPTIAVNALTKLITVDKVKIVIGDLTSSSTLAMVPIAKDNKILLISPTASNPSLSNSGDYFFRVWPSDNYSGVIAAKYSFINLKKRNAAIVYINNDYGLGLKDVYKKTFEKLGGNVPIIESYKTDQVDFRATLTKLKAQKIDIVYVPGHPMGIANILKQSRELVFNSTFFSDVAAEDKDFVVQAGKVATGLFFVTPSFDIMSKDSLTMGFVNDYRHLFGETPDVHAVKGYEASTVLLEGLKSTPTFSVQAIIQYLRIKTFSCISGKLKFDSHGDVLTSMAVKKYNESNNIEIVYVTGTAE